MEEDTLEWRSGTAHGCVPELKVEDKEFVGPLTESIKIGHDLNPYRFSYRLSFLLLLFLTSSTSSMGTLLSSSQEGHPFTPYNLAYDLVASPGHY
jgi:hypothetical protein